MATTTTMTWAAAAAAGSNPAAAAAVEYADVVQVKTGFHEEYKTCDRLNAGAFGTVYTCQRLSASAHETDHSSSGGGAEFWNDDMERSMRSSGSDTFAVKVLKRQKMNNHDCKAVFREVYVLQQCQDIPHVVAILDFFQDADHFYVVQVYAAGGNLFERLSHRRHYTEANARNVALVLLQVLNNLHAKRILHRDLKPENLLLQSPHDDTSILLADFGFARQLPKNDNAKCQTRCGTPAFVAPEILRGDSYNQSVDLWSAGCLIYMLLGGYAPFTCTRVTNHRALFRKIRAADYCFHDPYFTSVSVAAKQVMSHLLTVNVATRWTASQALQSDWFQAYAASQLENNALPESLRQLEQFSPNTKWKASALAVRWAATAPFWSCDKVSFLQQLTTWDKSACSNKSDMKEASSLPEMSIGSTTTIIEEEEELNMEDIIEDDDDDLDACAAAPLNEGARPKLSKSSRPSRDLFGQLPLIQFDLVYELQDTIRKGTQAVVYKCRHKATDQIFACKVISRVGGLSSEADQAVLNEVSILQSLQDNKYVVPLYDFYEQEEAFYLVLEYMPGGDVFDQIVQLQYYTERHARDVITCLLKAVASLQEAGICHRDLKPQNLIIVDDTTAEIKLVDFGFARRVHTPESLTSRMGTPTYVAPEILKNIPHDGRVDLWSIGVVTFCLLVGYPPFMEDSQPLLFERIRTGTYSFFQQDWQHVSKPAIQFIRGLLQVDPNDRWTVAQALQSEWINLENVSEYNLSDSVRAMRESKRHALRNVAKAVVWMANNNETKAVVEVSTQSS